MSDYMNRLCDVVSETSSLYGRPTDEQTDEAIVKAVLNALVDITRERAEHGTLNDLQIHRYTTMAVANALGLTDG